MVSNIYYKGKVYRYYGTYYTWQKLLAIKSKYPGARWYWTKTKTRRGIGWNLYLNRS